MPFVIFATPFFTENAVRFIEAIAGLRDIRLGVISQEPQEVLAPSVREKVVGHWRIDDALNTEQLAWAARSLAQRQGAIDHLFAANEQIQVPIAEARTQLGIAGMSVETALNFRDKARMKTLFRAAGIPCARHRLVSSEAEAWQFANEVGYPLVVKPPAGAASQNTYRVDGPDALREALRRAAPSAQQALLLEEFVTGDEHSFDTFSVNGKHVWHSLTRYLPSPLEAMQNPWIQWRVVLPTHEIDSPQYDDIRKTAVRALDVLGMETGLTHLEWFRRRDGSIAISEVAARPPGAQITTLMSRAHEFDCLQAWARLMVYGAFEPPPRRYATGAAYLRGQGRGVVKATHGWGQAKREVGHLVTDAKLPQIGQAPSPSYEGEGYVIMRHPETKVVEEALLRLITLMRVELG